jgi:hypothetical protein
MSISVQERSAPQLDRLRALTRLLDDAIPIPGTKYRFGLDAIIGLVPGLGDAIGAIFSVFIVYHAARLGAPKTTLFRMMSNIGVDTIVGEIPLLGDLFDFGWKANRKNLILLEQHLNQPTAARRTSRRVLLLVALGLVVILAVVVALGIWIANMTVVKMT